MAAMAKLCIGIKIMLVGGVETVLGSIKIITLVGLVKILIGDVVRIMLGHPNSAWKRQNFVEASKLS